MALAGTHWDLIVVGAGTAGIPAAIAAADRGIRVLLVDKSDRLGGTLHVSGGQMSAGGTRIQARLGVQDSPEAHFADVVRMTKSLPDPALVRRAIDEAPGVIDWLEDLGFTFAEGCPAASHFNVHDPYSAPRVYWGPAFGSSILEVLLPELERREAADEVTVARSTALIDVLVANGTVSGARLEDRNGPFEVTARSVLLATGGYGAAPELFEELSGYRLVSAAMSTSTGDALRLLRERFDVAVRVSERSLPTFGGLEDPARPHVALPWEQWPVLTPQMRPPWEVFVNLEGQRFVREDEPDVQTREGALRDQPATTFWVVFDEHIRTQAPPLMPAWDAGQWNEYARGGDIVVRADTLEGLASRMQVPEEAFLATVAAYNEAVAIGADPLGRSHLPAPIAEPPFVGLRNHATTLRTHAGLVVDEDLRVITRDGAAVPGLFAVGEALGGVSMSGDGFAAGMSVTPALALGRYAGRTLP